MAFFLRLQESRKLLLRSETKRFIVLSSSVSNKKYADEEASDFSKTAIDSDGDFNKDAKDPDEMLSVRNISRMPSRYRDRMSHVVNAPAPPDYYTDLHIRPGQKKKLLGHFGMKSGVNPGMLWPSAEELHKKRDFEKEWEPTLQERWQKLEETKETEMAEKQKKKEIVDAQMAKMPHLIKQFKARLAKTDNQELQLEMKRKALLDEARDYFGYSIDPRDPRFEQMKEQKEEEEKKLKKKKKKEEQMTRFMSSLK